MYAVSSVQPIDRVLSDATTPGQSGTGIDSNDEYSTFPKDLALWNYTIRLFSVTSRTLEKRLVYSTAQADWAIKL